MSIQCIKFEKGKIITIGSSSAISTSKIKKITAIKKNRSEKGSRDDLLGSNPHSKGDDFSRSIIDFFDRIDAKIITIVEIAIRMVAIRLMIIIIYPEWIFSPFDWKSTILYTR